ncbi:MAG: hypothetical protein IPN36_16960 [Bacteroidetes bacterium]|nr:hypothetical protein [Bacteroidota bacterium]
MDYKAPENIFWLFSAAAQSIAAFVGFLAAGYIFINERMDKAVDLDGTLVDIYEVIRKQHYKRLKILFVLTGLSIVLSLSVTFLNSYNLGVWGLVYKCLVGGLDVFTVFLAIKFVLFILHPDRLKRTAKQMIDETKNVFVEDAVKH